MADRGWILVGASHRSAPLELLEAVSLTREQVAERLPEARRRLDLDEAMLLATCNRTELLGRGSLDEERAGRMEGWLLELSRGDRALSREHLYVRRESDAAEHLFRTACGLESLMVGETEIAGQIQLALESARRAGTCGARLEELISSASRACKRARTETGINAGHTSVAAAAVHLARRVFGELSRRSVAVLGAGETGTLAARHFRQHSPRTLYVANRTAARAAELARAVEGEALPFDDRVSLVRRADVVVCATHAAEPLITGEVVRAAMGRRSGRMLLLVDISLPRNVEPACGEMENVFLYDMGDLETIVKRNLERRAGEVPLVEKIIDEELGAYLARRATQRVGPVIRELHQRFEELRARELERFAPKLSDEDRELADRMSRDLVKKLLHWPTLEIRALGRNGDADAELLGWARQLFGLDKATRGRRGE
jgi:glutamyl-tRNA reductase